MYQKKIHFEKVFYFKYFGVTVNANLGFKVEIYRLMNSSDDLFLSTQIVPSHQFPVIESSISFVKIVVIVYKL